MVANRSIHAPLKKRERAWQITFKDSSCYNAGMTAEHIEFTVGNMRLAGTIMHPDAHPATAGVLRISGGANQAHWPNQWQQWLAEQNIASFGFDFRGVDESDCKLEETTLAGRLEDARAARETLARAAGIETAKLYLLGVSMGAPLAIQLAHEYQPGGLILVSPAAYTPQAFYKPFGSQFTSTIQEPESWKQSQEFETLEAYNGPWMLALGTDDEVIPAPILERYADITTGRCQTLLKLNASHAFLRETDPETSTQEEFWQEMISFIDPTNDEV